MKTGVTFLLAAVNAKYIHSNPAIYSLRAYAGKDLQQHVELAEYTINQSLGEILGDIYRRKPDVIGFSCYIWNWRLIRELLGEIPKLLPETKLWLGGPEVSYDAHRILEQLPQLSGVMVGEGEATFRELLEYYVKCAGAEAEREGGSSLEQIRGLCLPSGYTPYRELLDMAGIPFLYDDLQPFENKIIYYESSRGCPFRCSYCLSSVGSVPCGEEDAFGAGQATFTGKRVRLRDISVVKRELQFFLDHRVKQVKFVDRTFNCDHGHAMAVWQYLQENDNGVTNFHFEISADILQEDETELLGRLRPGLVQLEIGVQSVNPDTLRAIKRGADLEKLERAVAAIRKSGNIHQHLDLIAGLPYESYESFGRSFDRVYRMRPQQLQLGFLKVLKGSEMWERAGEYGIRYLEQPPYEVLYTRWLSYGEVHRLKRIEEMVELYYNSGQFAHTMAFLEKAFPGPFAMYGALADFYEEKGYFTASPARGYRYQALYAFAAKRDGGRREVYRELLTYDMYLRENVKSRPDFAADLTPYKEEIREFYRGEERQRNFLPDYEGYDWKQLGKMTHMEPFTYPVWDEGQMAEGYAAWGITPGQEDLEAVSFVLFDYKKRNPLNYEAAAQVLRRASS